MQSRTIKAEAHIDYEQKEAFLYARSQIHMELQRHWTVEEMAQLVNLSPSRFFYLYKNFFNISPQKDLIHKRIETAQILISRDNLKVEKAAELTGYSNQYHFIRQFKQITGTTPGKKNKSPGAALT